MGKMLERSKKRIESTSDFVPEFEENPIKLLKAIKENALDYQENRYRSNSAYDTMKALIDCKKSLNESIIYQTKKLKVA